MGTSELGGAINYASADLGADRFADVLLMRDLLSTAKHKADQAAQVRANWSTPVTALWTANSDPHNEIYGPGVEGALDVATEDEDGSRWFQFGPRVVYCPNVRADGSAYPLRVRVGGRNSDAGGAVVDFGLIVVPAGLADLGLDFGASGADRYPSKLYSGVTYSASPAYLTPDDGSHLITIPRGLVDEALLIHAAAWSTLTDIGGLPISVQMPLLQVIPIGQTYGGVSVPELHTLYVAEFVGKT